LVEEKEWFPTIQAIVYTYGFAHGAGTNGNISVVPSPKALPLHPGSLFRWSFQSEKEVRVAVSASNSSEAQG